MSATHRYTVPVTPEDRERVAARLTTAGALGVWERGGELIAWFTAPAPVPPGGVWELEPERDWSEEWKAGLTPLAAGRFMIVPSWLADDHAPADDEVTLVLDPGRAFGSGHHATTLQCLELLDDIDRREGVRGRRVADVGCGTGILAIAAALLGAAPVIGADIDADAVEVTAENAARNHAAVTAIVGSAAELAPDGPFDVVFANLLTDTVVALAADLVGLVAPGGHLVSSGIGEERVGRVVAALTAAGLAEPEVRVRDGWAALRAGPA